jgi:tRNA U34 5-methylaminomethyl-2-thiouridine-forming methyltransferase MnmC
MGPSDFVPLQTEDGSTTLYSKSYDESYHSVHGAEQESRHVFLQAGLQQCPKSTLRLFEVGFGTGLNALLTWAEAKRNRLQIHYIAVEAFPLDPTTVSALGFDCLKTDLPSDATRRLHQAEWGVDVMLDDPCFSLCKLKGNFETLALPSDIDLVYFDAFAPDKQPEMWEEHLFERLYHAMNVDSILVTYCAKGEVRRRLQRCGFTVERIPGPPGKREMIRARKQAV